MTRGVGTRTFAMVDRFAAFQLARAERLRASEAWLLVSLVLLADHEYHQWAGSLTDLARETRLDRRAVRRAYDTLLAAGLVDELEPFHQGGEGRLRVGTDAWAILVADLAQHTAEALAGTGWSPDDRDALIADLNADADTTLGESADPKASPPESVRDGFEGRCPRCCYPDPECSEVPW